MSADNDDDLDTRGWDAINTACERLYAKDGKVEPMHYGTIIKYALGGPDPLDGVSIYRNGDHLHYVSFGLSELYQKESANPEHSGWGCELTFRLRTNDVEPPKWPVSLMQNLARYVFDSGNVLHVNDHMSLNGPIRADDDTALTAVLFARDPDLGVIDTPNGRVEFRQIVGVTSDELEAVCDWNTEKFLAALQTLEPKWVTDLARPTVLESAAFRQQVEEGTARDGSSLGANFVSQLTIDGTAPMTVTIPVFAVRALVRGLRGRLAFEREFRLFGPNETRLALVPSLKDEVRASDDGPILALTPATAQALAAALRPEPDRSEAEGETRLGTYRAASFGDVVIEVEPTKT